MVICNSVRLYSKPQNFSDFLLFQIRISLPFLACCEWMTLATWNGGILILVPLPTQRLLSTLLHLIMIFILMEFTHGTIF